ncbi:unnamed protein product [Trichobilharzia regenti]|nr:unnamed protein product [Trichobilharzia regenti]
MIIDNKSLTPSNVVIIDHEVTQVKSVHASYKRFEEEEDDYFTEKTG